MRRRIIQTAVGALLALSIASPAVAQVRGSDGLPPRDEWQKVPEILAAMGAIDGKRVADVAAGQGYLTRPLSRKVGASGRVFAVEIGEVERAALAKLAHDSFPNVEVVASTAADPKIPGQIDAAVVLNSYHEFTNYREMLDGIKRALRPGGVLVLVDNSASESTQTRDWQASHHGLNATIVEQELRTAGFEIATRRDDFIVQPYAQWMFVARKPAR